MVSTLPPTKPATVPQVTPIVNATMVARKPTIKETLLPYIILVSKSLPRVSVPNQCSAEGGDGPSSRF